MKKIALSVAAVALTAGSALAADLPSRKGPPMLPPPPPPPMWTGFYVGLNAGGTWSNSNATHIAGIPGACDPATPGCLANYSITTAQASTFWMPGNGNGGFLGGGQVGYNWQFYNSFVVGIEADIQGVASNRQSSNAIGGASNPVFPGFPLISTASTASSLDYIGTVRGRLGWLFTPTLLLYGTGGLAYGGVNSTVGISSQYNIAGATFPTFSAGAFSDTLVGWTAGGGVEWMFLPNWSAKVEYLYYDLGNVTYNATPLFTSSIALAGQAAGTAIPQVSHRYNGNIVRAGLNYHFNWGSAPVVAKY